MTKPGNKSGQEGGAVPLSGGFEIQGKSTGDLDVLTITAPSTMDAKYLVCRSYAAEGTTGGDDVFSVSSGGVMAFRGFRSTTASTAGASTKASTACTNALGSSALGKIYKVGVVTVAATGDSAFAIKLPSAAAGKGADISFILSSNTGTPSSATKAGFSFISSDAIMASGAAHDKYNPAGTSGASSVGELAYTIVRFLSDGTYWYPMQNNEQSASQATPTANS